MMQQPATCRASASAAPKIPPGPKPEWDHGSPNPAIGKPWLEPKKITTPTFKFKNLNPNYDVCILLQHILWDSFQ